MKTLIATLSAVAALTAVAAPAAAQGYGYDRGNDRGYGQTYERGYDHNDNRGYGQSFAPRGYNSVDARQAQIRAQIERGQRNGAITQREARRLWSDYQDIARDEQRARSGGLNRYELAQLDQRLVRLEARVQFERRDDDHGRRW